MERLPAHVKAEAELPVGSQGRDGQRGGKNYPFNMTTCSVQKGQLNSSFKREYASSSLDS